MPEFNNDIELGDTDGDGDLDLLVPIFEPYGLITFRNLGDGQFGDAESTPGPASSLECTTGDIEGDGDLDVVILGLGFCPLLNRGDGTFDTRRLFAQGEVFGSTILADLDLDSDLDILTADAFSQEPVTLLGNGDGTFGPLTPAGQSAPAAYYPFVFDATSDGIPDLIGLGENTIIALPGLGDGTFGTPVLSPTAFAQHAPFWGDFNLDGHLDLFLLAPFALVPPPSIVLFGDGAGGFVEGPSMQWAGVGLAFADFNEDGILDSAIRLISPPGIQVRLGVGNGTFGPPSTVTPSIGPSVPRTIFVADYDKDGHVDLLASVSSNGAGIVVIPGDGDGTFGAPVASPAAIAGAPADFDLDGNLDLFVFTAGGFGICFGDGAGNFSAPAVFAASSLISSATTPLGDIDGDGDVDIVGLDSFQLGLQVIKNRRYR